MKRLLGLGLLVALLLGVGVSHQLVAQVTDPPPEIPPGFVCICHLTMSEILPNGDTLLIGEVQCLPPPQALAHIILHGDILLPSDDIELPSCCGFCRNQMGEIIDCPPID